MDTRPAQGLERLVMKCKNESCDNIVTGKSGTCSPKCRKALSRASVTPSVTKNAKDVTVKPSSVTNTNCDKASVTKCDTVTTVIIDDPPTESLVDYTEVIANHKAGKPSEPKACLEHYQSYPDRYAKRNDAEALNWGEPMSSNELNKAGLKANRVSIPGDWDYIEPTKSEAKPTGKLTPQLLAKLPGGVSVPSAQPTTDTAKLTATQLNANISTYTGIAWKYSPEYAELIHRLLTWPKQKLVDNGHVAPSWKDSL